MSESSTSNNSGRLDAHHPIVFRESFARFAGRLQWALLLAGTITTPVGAIAWITGAANWIPLIVGAGLFSAGIVWSQIWRRLVKRSWWGDRYGSWT